MRWLVRSVFFWRIEWEEFGEELGLGDCDSSVGVMGEVESEGAGCIAV